MSDNLWLQKYMTPSRIDSYIYHRDNEEHTVELFIKELLKIDQKFLINMNAGTAVHSYIEQAGFSTITSFKKDGWNVSCAENLNVVIELPEIRELKIFKKWQDITIKGKVDCISCNTIHDIKTTKQIKIDKYAESWQWKLYLWMTNKYHFVYNVFEIKIIEELNNILINNYEELKLTKYPTMENDINNILTEYKNYLIQLKPQIDEMKILYGIK